MSTRYTPKPALQLYRDCLRLIRHLGGKSSPKAVILRDTIRRQFRENMRETDPAKLHAMKQQVERGLSNYLIFERSKQDPKIAAAAARMYEFEDDEKGNLVAVEPQSTRRASGAATSKPKLQ